MNGKQIKLLLITNDLYPHLNANSEIVYRLADELHNRYSFDITILGLAWEKEEKDVLEKDKYKTICIHTRKDLNTIQKKYKTKWERLLHVIIHPDCIPFYYAKKRHDLHPECILYQNAIKKALRYENYDCIVGFSVPFDSLRALSRIQMSIPFIAYKLDPWSTYYIIKDREGEKKDEIKADLAAASIIVTDLIRKEYPENTEKEIIDKLHVLKFPNIIHYNVRPLSCRENHNFHCVFTGAFYKDIRNPRFTIKLFEALQHDSILLDIFGKCYGEECLPKPLPMNVIDHGFVPSNDALRYMQGADVLVNIGNTVLNQMPSKILTYISLGKPILNIIKTPECPTLPYLEKYPLALNVLETEVPTEEDVARVRNFIKNSKGKSVPFEEIEKLYYDCTPEYVGSKVYDIICDVVEKSKRG